jgi:hypothetical protein
MHSPIAVQHLVAAAVEEDRHSGEARRHDHHRALLEARAARPSRLATLRAAVLNARRDRHALTDYPCRLPDGRIGRVAVVLDGGEWTLVCRVV